MSAENMFSPTFGNRPPRIIGRQDEIDRFLTGLKARPGHPNRATLYIGQRGMGKTALLLELADRARMLGFIPVRVTASEKMLDEIIEGLQLAGAKSFKGKGLSSVSAGAFGFSAGLSFTSEIQQNFGFRTKLTLLIQEMAKRKKGVVFFVDEVQANTPEMRELATTYQHLVGEGADIAIALAGLPSSISMVLQDRVLTFLNRAHKERLDALKLGDISVYYAQVLTDLGIGFESATLQKAAAATVGYPYLLQLVGYYLLHYLGAGRTLSETVVDLAIGSAKSDLRDSIFLPCLSGLSPEDRRFLDAMALDLETSAVSELRQRLGASASHVQKYKQRLVEAGVIASPSRGQLEFVVPFLADYLREIKSEPH
ncbi:MAG: ATP-binding protein [Lachnospiraceae bacterium]|jgi:hypothetical protein|nr:ATP-binding protein [Lachnospiraceae bacterium]